MPNPKIDPKVVEALLRVWQRSEDVRKLGLEYHLDRTDWTSYRCEILVTAKNLAGHRASQIDDVMRSIQRQLDSALGSADVNGDPSEVHLFLDVLGEAA